MLKCHEFGLYNISFSHWGQYNLGISTQALFCHNFNIYIVCKDIIRVFKVASDYHGNHYNILFFHENL
jgi:hypothetical protein